jgi:hypothetical protein
MHGLPLFDELIIKWGVCHRDKIIKQIHLKIVQIHYNGKFQSTKN